MEFEVVQDTPSRKLDQYIVRFPDGMRDRLKAAAADNNRSMNAEIVARLEESLSSQREDGTQPEVTEAIVKTTIAAFIEEMMHLPSNAPISVVLEKLRKTLPAKD